MKLDLSSFQHRLFQLKLKKRCYSNVTLWFYLSRYFKFILVSILERTTDPKRIHKAVPKPFQANNEGIMAAWFAYERKVKSKMAAHEYLKAVLAIPVEYKGKGCQ